MPSTQASRHSTSSRSGTRSGSPRRCSTSEQWAIATAASCSYWSAPASSIPASLLAAFAPSIEVLFGARILGGLAAGLAFPTTLALITALWSGPGPDEVDRALVGLGAAISSLGPLLAGAMLTQFDWGSVFLITLPLAVVALVLAHRFVPAHVNETTDPVDNLGGILSVLMIAALVLAINFAAVPNEGALADRTRADRAGRGRGIRNSPAARAAPLYDLKVAGRRIFWVAAVAGIIVFGTLMGAMFIGQQYLQNVLEYSTLGAGAAILPGAVGMVLMAPRSAKLIESRGSRFTLLVGYSSACSASWPCSCCGMRARRTGRLGWPIFWSAPASALRARLIALAHRLGPGLPRRDGLGHDRPSARSRRRDHAVDPGGRLDRGLFSLDRGGDLKRPGQGEDQRQHANCARRSPSQAPVSSRSSIRSTQSRSSPPHAARSSTATIARTWRASSRSCSAR